MKHSLRKVLITGVTRGLGLAMAEKLIELGHTIAGCGRSKASVTQLRQRFGSAHELQALDVADDPAVQAWSQRVFSKMGPPDLLLNNAALANSPAPLWTIPAREFDPIIDVNIKGVTNVIRHFVPAMIQQNKGIIVNFSSGWGRSTSPGVAPYCATKWAIEGLSRALAQELPGGLACIALSPGVINTDMLKLCFGAAAESYALPQQWAQTAVPFILKLGPDDNGKSLSVP